MKTRLTIVVCLAILQGCFSDPESPRGFRLPEGDAGQGLQAFEDLQCYACHAVEGVELPSENTGPASVILGGDVSRVKTYGELVTSIINPSHRLAPGYKVEEGSIDDKSPMEYAYLNDVMTVRQLTDLVTFLQPLYEVIPPSYNPYGYAYPSYP